MRRVRAKARLRPDAWRQLRWEIRRVVVAVSVAWGLISLMSVTYATLSALVTGLWSILTTLVLVVSIAAAGVTLTLCGGLVLLAVWINRPELHEEEEADSGEE